VMAAQHRSLPRYGVQFHPESILTPEGPRIVENFLRLTAS
ncbi:MAG: glutamine amidotransferase-related protein, partial [Actinomycetota bacterium]